MLDRPTSVPAVRGRWHVRPVLRRWAAGIVGWALLASWVLTVVQFAPSALAVLAQRSGMAWLDLWGWTRNPATGDPVLISLSTEDEPGLLVAFLLAGAVGLVAVLYAHWPRRRGSVRE